LVGGYFIMYSWLIIDGYNIIHKWPDLVKAKLKNIEFAREKFNTIIQKYSDFKGIKITIVYDGQGKERSNTKDNPEIVFSKSTETADSIIEYLVQNHDNPKEILVATDDNVQRSFIITAGAWYISAADFESEVNSVLGDMRKRLS